MGSAWLHYAALLVSVLSMSWGGPLFGVLVGVPPAMKACWRLTLTTVLMVPGFISDFRAAPVELRLRWRKNLTLICGNGVNLGLHFIAFSVAIERTSFAHAMLLPASVPMWLVLWSLMLWGVWRVLEVTGSCAGSSSAGKAASADKLSGSDSLAQTHNLDEQIPGTAPEYETASYKLPQLGVPLEHASVSTGNLQHARTLLLQLAGVPIPSGALENSPATAVRNPVCPSGVTGAAVAPIDSGPPAVSVSTPDPRILPPTSLEIAGSLVAFSGMVALVLLQQREGTLLAAAEEDGSAALSDGLLPANTTNHSTTDAGASIPASLQRPFSVAGDVAALAAAVCMAAYMLVGARVRAWLPVWLYSCPLVAAAALTTGALSLALEPGATAGGLGPAALMGWAGDPGRFGIALALAFVPGILGHTLANWSLSRIDPLMLSVTQLTQPGIAAVYGYWLGLQSPPGVPLLLAAPIMLVGIAAVLLGGRKSPLWRRLVGLCRQRPSAPSAGTGTG